jgi:hypothetical protein
MIMKRSGILAAVGLLSLVTSAAYSKSIAYDGKTTIGSGTATSINQTGTSSGCAGVLIESLDPAGCLPGITSLSFTPGDTAGTSSYTEIVSENSYTAFLWPASSESAFDSNNNGPVSQIDVVAAVISGAGPGACAGSSTANCWSLEFDYDSVTKAGGSPPVITPLSSCPGTYGAASVSIVAGGVTSTYTSSNPCAINGTEMDFVGSKLTATFCSNGAPCGTPTMTGGTSAAPEIDSTSALSALTLFAGCLAVFCGVPRAPRQRAMVRPPGKPPLI